MNKVRTQTTTWKPTIAIVGGGPAALVMAIALARRGLSSTVFERDAHPEIAPRFNPDRSYTIDITGHGAKALRYIEATHEFDQRLIPFKGIKAPGHVTEEWTEPGWTGSRGDILRALLALIEGQYPDFVRLEYNSHVDAVDVYAGTLKLTRQEQTVAWNFDLVIGGDGAGSVVRKAMTEQVAGFSVTQGSIPNYATMLELDRVGDRLDPSYLYMLSPHPPCVAGAINGTNGPSEPRWFCMVGSGRKRSFASADEVRRFFRSSPRVLEMASDKAIEAFAGRECYHIGRSLTCSQLYGGKAVLLGDAASPFPPIGQGVNAAMESAMQLDLCLAASGDGLEQALQRYNAAWKPEAEAVSWISEKMMLGNPLHLLRGAVTTRLGLSVFGQAKRSDVPYSQVRRDAERRWPLWA